MAKTYTTRPMGAIVMQNPVLSAVMFHEPEGASQTFVEGTPVVFASGLLVACTSPITTDDSNYVAGLTVEDGENVASGGRTKYIPAIDGVMFFANFMTGDGADNTLAAADLMDIAGCAARSKSGLITTGVTDWFLDDADANGATVVSFKSDIILPNTDPTWAEVGDTNARVGFVFIDAVVAWGYRIVSA